MHLLNEMAGNSMMVFCSTCAATQTMALLLRNLGFLAIPLHGQMAQNKRLAALNKFKGLPDLLYVYVFDSLSISGSLSTGFLKWSVLGIWKVDGSFARFLLVSKLLAFILSPLGRYFVAKCARPFVTTVISKTSVP